MLPFIRSGLWCLSLCLVLSGCAVLTDSQVKNINAFATTTKAYSAFPSAVVKQYADLHRRVELLDATGQPDTALVFSQLERARATYNSNIDMAGKFDLSLQLLQQYGSLLAQLSSPDFVSDLSGPTTDLGGNLDHVIALYNKKVHPALPVSLGSDLSKLILLAGEKLTKRKQTKALKQFVLAADTLVQATAKNLADALDVGMQQLLSIDRDRWTRDARSMIASEMNGAPRGMTLRKYQGLQFYYDGVSDWQSAEDLRSQVMKAAASLAQAHAALVKAVREKKDLAGVIDETKQLITDVQPLGPILSKYIPLPKTFSL
ncbi:hypothetical protein [Puia dinghuensis]|uniref:Imelysin-like domain-containing protein n=1 Tax=Puia dinghuensis TaxID=1792502 RepID=A0A8J2UIJ3_9BACT|nr:hypothetical protein [Puia dinghuensis]GGB23415.1 hypothetical protein GCM10011511_54100 [Puia dinghuensis]